MDEAERTNAVLEREAPLVARLLSPRGRRVALPRKILFQAAQAAGSEYNATIGQITDGRGNPMPIPEIDAALVGVDRKVAFLYSPQQGQPAVRQAWGERQRRHAGGSVAPTGLPIATLGLTHGLATLADLFADEDTDVVIPMPFWENYELIFTLFPGARLVTFPALDGDGFNVQGLADALAGVRGKAIVILNIPGNPTGFTPTVEQAERIVEVLVAHPGPAVAVLDDAYAGMVWEPGLQERSLFWDLLEKADPERLFPIKVDGTTKELLFFPSRIGFLTHGLTGEAEAALLSKIQGLGRASVGSPPGPSQALVLAALRSPTLEASIGARFAVLRERYERLKSAVGALPPTAVPCPFNSGCFALIRLDPSFDAEEVRQRLLAEHSVGTLSIPEVNALRLAYCSTAPDDLEVIVDRIGRILSR